MKTTTLTTYKNSKSYEKESECIMNHQISDNMKIMLDNPSEDVKYSLLWIPNVLEMLWFIEQWCETYGADKVLNHARGKENSVHATLEWYIESKCEEIHPDTPSGKIIDDLFESVVKKLNKLKSGAQTFKDF